MDQIHAEAGCHVSIIRSNDEDPSGLDELSLSDSSVPG
ncbi:uncharacterized protein RCO7_15167 [Rhynchosporium graminicola]|uniref:Uncharacterized protein n=1 Tax=Rhynchosporium graminicola TaxID=2792576 RepID=A0A1E1LNF4_9HELO|nr:uncharacterized protein RCO7_15167 [Rhynchosporium commune]